MSAQVAFLPRGATGARTVSRFARAEHGFEAAVGTHTGVPVSVVCVRRVASSGAVVSITTVIAYPAGVRFALSVQVPGDGGELLAAASQSQSGSRLSGTIPDDAMRVGVEFSDGRTAVPFYDAFLEPVGGEDAPCLVYRRGDGLPGYIEIEYWLAPLPPSGRLAVVLEWPIFGIERTELELPADVIREAASSAGSVADSLDAGS